MVVLCSWLFDIALSAIVNVARYDLGFYSRPALRPVRGEFRPRRAAGGDWRAAVTDGSPAGGRAAAGCLRARSGRRGAAAHLRHLAGSDSGDRPHRQFRSGQPQGSMTILGYPAGGMMGTTPTNSFTRRYRGKSREEVRSDAPRQGRCATSRPGMSTKTASRDADMHGSHGRSPSALFLRVPRPHRKHAAEAQLRQSQKMEAVGQLTGGVAHDFNNILTVITGTIEILAKASPTSRSSPPIAKLIDEAAERGAELTQQLLAFARRQPLQPREIDVNDAGRSRPPSCCARRSASRSRSNRVLADGRLAGPGRSRPARDRAPQPRAQRARRHAGRRQADVETSNAISTKTMPARTSEVRRATMS